jgi:hypothetical protein
MCIPLALSQRAPCNAWTSSVEASNMNTTDINNHFGQYYKDHQPHGDVVNYISEIKVMYPIMTLKAHIPQISSKAQPNFPTSPASQEIVSQRREQYKRNQVVSPDHTSHGLLTSQEEKKYRHKFRFASFVDGSSVALSPHPAF